MQGSYNAEYGRAIGSVVNMITKSGTNDFHGSLFEYNRNEKYNARNFFDHAPKKQPFKVNQFGGDLGGPIIKDKLFFFASYEGVRQVISQSLITPLLSQAARAQAVPSMGPIIAELPPVPAGATPIPDTNGDLVHRTISSLLYSPFSGGGAEAFGDERFDSLGSPR